MTFQEVKPPLWKYKAGQAKVVVPGTDPGRDGVGILLDKYAQEQGIAPCLTGKSGVLAVPRARDAEGQGLLNINNVSKSISLPGHPFAGTTE